MQIRGLHPDSSRAMAFKAIFFDAAGTLIMTSRPVGESYALLARRHGIEVDAAQLTQRFRSCFAGAPPLAFPGVSAAEIQELERRWWKELVQAIFEPFGRFSRFDEYFSELFKYFGQVEAWRCYPEAQETLSALTARGLTLAVISNFDSRLFGILEGLGISRWVDSVVISSQAGYAKPAVEIFEKALKHHGLAPEQAFHVGDSFEKDALGASRAGLTGVLLDRSGKEARTDFPRIRTLREILPLVDSA